MTPLSQCLAFSQSDLKEKYKSFLSIQGVNINEGEKCLVDILAVVISFTPPRQGGNGRDLMMNLSLVDNSITPLSEDEVPLSFQMNIFCSKKEYFPCVRIAGDVIRMHRVELKTFGGQVQLTGLKKSSYVVCRREDQSNGALEWSFIASQKTTPTEDEKHEMRQLWLWGQARQVRIVAYAFVVVEASWSLISFGFSPGVAFLANLPVHST